MVRFDRVLNRGNHKTCCYWNTGRLLLLPHSFTAIPCPHRIVIVVIYGHRPINCFLPVPLHRSLATQQGLIEFLSVRSLVSSPCREQFLSRNQFLISKWPELQIHVRKGQWNRKRSSKEWSGEAWTRVSASHQLVLRWLVHLTNRILPINVDPPPSPVHFCLLLLHYTIVSFTGR